MCKNCILLGALFNASEADNFPSHVLSQYDFKVDQESENLRDKAATEYLKDTLEIFRQVIFVGCLNVTHSNKDSFRPESN